MGKYNEQPPATRGLLPLLLTIGGFCLFAIVIAFVWKDRSPPAVAQGGLPAEERAALLQKHREEEQQTLTTYGWVDQANGVVRIPVERAMDLVLEELNQGQSQN